MREKLKRCTAFVLTMIFCLTFLQPANADLHHSRYKDFIYYTGAGKVYVIGYKGTKSTITLPSEINGKEVVEVYSMSKADTVRTVILSKNISSCDLSDALQIKNIKVVEDNPYLTVCNNCVIKNYTTIIDAPGGIKRVDSMPDSVTTVSSAFYGSNLEEVTIGKNVRRLLMSFWRCKNLKTVRMNAKLRYVGPNTFRGCTSLKTIRLGKNVTTIERDAFSESGLKKIVIKNPYCYIANRSIPSRTVIYGYKNSTAQEYARANGNKFVKLD